MKKILKALILTTAVLYGCLGERAKRFWRLVEIRQELKYGTADYYTNEQKQEPMEEFKKNLNYLNNLSKKIQK